MMFSTEILRLPIHLCIIFDRHYKRKQKNIPIQTLWKYNKVLLFFTMTPRNLSWHPDFMLMPAWQLWRKVMAGLSYHHTRPSESCWCPPFTGSQGPHSFQAATSPFLPLSLSPPYLTLIYVTVSSRAAWFIIQIASICIVTITLCTVCCIWLDMPKWPLVTNAHWPQEYDEMMKRTTSSGPTTLLMLTQTLSRSGVSNIWPAGQNQPTMGSNSAHWITLVFLFINLLIDLNCDSDLNVFFHYHQSNPRWFIIVKL